MRRFVLFVGGAALTGLFGVISAAPTLAQTPPPVPVPVGGYWEAGPDRARAAVIDVPHTAGGDLVPAPTVAAVGESQAGPDGARWAPVSVAGEAPLAKTSDGWSAAIVGPVDEVDLVLAAINGHLCPGQIPSLPIFVYTSACAEVLPVAVHESSDSNEARGSLATVDVWGVSYNNWLTGGHLVVGETYASSSGERPQAGLVGTCYAVNTPYRTPYDIGYHYGSGREYYC